MNYAKFTVCSSHLRLFKLRKVRNAFKSHNRYQCSKDNTEFVDKVLENNSLFSRNKVSDGPSLHDFIRNGTTVDIKHIATERIPYLKSLKGNGQKVYLSVHGCQMNVNDAEVITAILKNSQYILTSTIESADIVLVVTCAIRDKVEQKVWDKLHYLNSLKKKGKLSKIGLLGCMAERLKANIFKITDSVDIVAGPDSYRDLPRLLAISDNHETAINIALSLDETYADVTPVRLNPNSKTAFVSIMRGCDNMCTYCIVPFTRGRERSRPLQSILDEVRHLSDQGIKEVTLLGQNVNSYRDISKTEFYQNNSVDTNLAKGFKTVYKTKQGGLRFSDLLDKVSLINPEMRIRFTSPHPKDFPDEVLHLIAERPNICQHIHLPAQSGSNNVLSNMGRGYSREAYLELVYHIRSIIPNVTLSSDFIAGFCDETESNFQETLSLIKEVKYHSAYLYAYSMREKTRAFRRLTDNVNNETKLRRLQEMMELYRPLADKLNNNLVGEQQLVLINGVSKRSASDLQGRNDGNIKVILASGSIPENNFSSVHKPISIGDYVVVHICRANSQVLHGLPLYHSSIKEFYSPDKNAAAFYGI